MARNKGKRPKMNVPTGRVPPNPDHKSRSGTINWPQGAIPSVTGGKSPAMDFTNALMSGNPFAEHLVEEATASLKDDKHQPKEEASLADQFVAATYDIGRRLGLSAHQRKKIEPMLQSYRNDMRRAHRFVLDDDFVRYITEVSSTTAPEKLLYRLQFATIPYETTWIEFNLHIKVRVMRQVHDMDDSRFNYGDVADRLGLIIRRLSETEAVVELVCETHGAHGLIGTTICYFYSVREYAFTSKDTFGGCRPFLINEAQREAILRSTSEHAEAIKPLVRDDDLNQVGAASLWGYSDVGRSIVIDKMAQMRSLRLPVYLMRHGTLGTGRMREILETFIGLRSKEVVADTIISLLISETTEFTGMMRWIVCVLAALNEVPISTQRVEPQGYVRTGLTGRRPLMDYHKVTLRVPKTNPVQFINRRLGAHARHRAHEVRAHWRTYLHEQRCAREDHEWIYDHAEGYRLCGRCEAYGRLIHEHIRGDPSLGWVRKDYVVKPQKQE